MDYNKYKRIKELREKVKERRKLNGTLPNELLNPNKDTKWSDIKTVLLPTTKRE